MSSSERYPRYPFLSHSGSNLLQNIKESSSLFIKSVLIIGFIYKFPGSGDFR